MKGPVCAAVDSHIDIAVPSPLYVSSSLWGNGAYVLRFFPVLSVLNISALDNTYLQPSGKTHCLERLCILSWIVSLIWRCFSVSPLYCKTSLV